MEIKPGYYATRAGEKVRIVITDSPMSSDYPAFGFIFHGDNVYSAYWTLDGSFDIGNKDENDLVKLWSDELECNCPGCQQDKLKETKWKSWKDQFPNSDPNHSGYWTGFSKVPEHLMWGFGFGTNFKSEVSEEGEVRPEIKPGYYRTRNGRKVKVLCTDAPDPRYPVIGYSTNKVGAYENSWTIDGKFDADIGTHPLDLVDYWKDEEKKQCRMGIGMFRTRDGRRATVEHKFTQDGIVFPYVGVVDGHSCPVSWTEEGRVSTDFTHPLDLVSYWF